VSLWSGVILNKKIVSGLIALGLTITLNSIVLADPLQDMLKEKQAQEQQLKQQDGALKDAEDKVEELEIEIQMLDSQIEKIMVQIEGNKKAIIKSEAAIEVAKKEVEKAEEDIKDQQELFDKRMRAIYISGSQGYLSVILKSKGISDLVSRIETVNKIIQFDKKVVQELEDKKSVLQDKKVSLDKENINLQNIKTDNEKKLANLTESKKKQDTLVKEARRQQSLLVNKAKETKAAIAAAEKKIKELRDAAPKYNPSRGAATASQSNLIVYASNFMGTPYVWGGSSPKPGFDCSGFMQYVYDHFGINLSRTTYTQINEGVAVSRDKLQPGDLVFFGTWGDPHHVGMYVGENSYIHAPQTGDVIKISPLTRRDYLTARRILK
jgi:peptidoglycan DL-endopeptidase CwlO